MQAAKDIFEHFVAQRFDGGKQRECIERLGKRLFISRCWIEINVLKTESPREHTGQVLLNQRRMIARFDRSPRSRKVL